MAYTTAALIQAEIKGTGVASDELFRLANIVTNRVKRDFKISFEPFYKTKTITALPTNVNRALGLLDIGDLLLELTTLTNNGSSSTLGTNFVYYPQGVFPVKTLRLLNPYQDSWYSCNNSQFFDQLVLTGWFGYRENYDTEGWLSTTNTITDIGGLANTTALTTITVQSVNGANILGDTPAFSPGHLLRIDNEMMEVQATDTTLQKVTVRRAWNGTVAANHVQGATILFWNQADEISRVVARQAASLFSRKGAFNTIEVSGMGITQYPADLLQELRGTIRSYANL